MATDSTAEHRDWLLKVLPRHSRLAAAAKLLLENILQQKQIDYLSVTSRVKTLEGGLEKINRKEYSEPERQLTDLTGVRVITYLEQQVDQICAAVKGLFEVDDKNSLDRTEVLGDDKVGYRSTHFVCSLGKQRGKLPEYDGLGTLKFEIQVRTVLQHAWAELAHDRSFKFGKALPAKIQRKLNLYSGLLEIVDGAFDQIAHEVDDYSRELENKSIQQISDLEINDLSIKKLINDMAEEKGLKIREVGIQDSLMKEMKEFGISTIGNLKALMGADFIKAFKVAKANDDPSYYGLIRCAMMYNDLEKYLAIPTGWTGLTESTANLLDEKYGSEKVRLLMRKAGKLEA